MHRTHPLHDGRRYARVMTFGDAELGDFLRANRARVDPADVGLPAGASARRVKGLRREEVAVLAGVSVDYYARLEQGRERHPSPQMMEAIGRALRLNSDERGHLFRLAGLNPRLASDASRELVHPELIRLLEGFPTAAAYVLGPAFDVMAANTPATALLSPFAPVRSMPRILFTHPDARTVYPEWELLASATVHALRLNAGLFPGDAAIADLVAELSEKSAEFRGLWNDQTVAGLTRAFKVFNHPDVGRVELSYQSFDVRDAPGQQLLVGMPAVGSTSEQAMTFLASMASPLPR